jgi:hypothetical protein
LSEKSLALLMDIVWEIHGFADGYGLRNPYSKSKSMIVNIYHFQVWQK